MSGLTTAGRRELLREVERVEDEAHLLVQFLRRFDVDRLLHLHRLGDRKRVGVLGGIGDVQRLAGDLIDAGLLQVLVAPEVPVVGRVPVDVADVLALTPAERIVGHVRAAHDHAPAAIRGGQEVYLLVRQLLAGHEQLQRPRLDPSDQRPFRLRLVLPQTVDEHALVGHHVLKRPRHHVLASEDDFSRGETRQ